MVKTLVLVSSGEAFDASSKESLHSSLLSLLDVINATPFTLTFTTAFEGRAWGVGLMALYVAKVEEPGVFLQLRWINEFEVTNLLKGNTLMLGVTLKFK